jgi:Fur family zinc uptake transcriptional regulator
MGRTSKLLVHPKDMVLAALRKSSVPLTAYNLLQKLEPFGVKSAPIVYRALESLETAGEVHKIKGLGAYVACNCNEDDTHHAHHISLLTVCVNCKKVNELHDHAVIHYLDGLRQLHVNLPENAVIELPVICAVCEAAQPL